MRVVAIDFETANKSLLSPCSVGLARMEKGEIVDTFYTLLKPYHPYFDPDNIAIHGIKSEDVKEAPSFSEVWDDVLSFVGEDFLIAHNAPFDIGILKANLRNSYIPIPSIEYGCTLQIARKIWSDLPSHKLTYLSEIFNFEYNAHNALDDAINAAKVFHKACPCVNYDETKLFFSQFGVNFSNLKEI
jgi:DNA polymerase-3 subunit epsilon